MSLDVEIVGTSEVQELRVECFEVRLVRSDEIDVRREESVITGDREQR